MNVRQTAYVAISILVIGLIVIVSGIIYMFYNLIFGEGELFQTMLGGTIAIFGGIIASIGLKIKLPREKYG